MTRKQLVRAIAKDAMSDLGRKAFTSKRGHDWAAVDAVKMAAMQMPGMHAPLFRWVPQQPGRSMTALAEAYVARYVEAYGDHAIPSE